MVATWVIRGLDWWNRHRPWPIRERIFGLPPHPVATEAGTRLVVPCAGEDDVAEAAWTARSFLHRLDRAPAGRLALDLYLDSPDPALRTKIADRWTPLFPGSEVSSTWEAVEKLAPLMPTLDRLAVGSAAVRRLAVALHAQEEYNVILAEPGVVLLGNSAEFAEALHHGRVALHLQRTGLEADENPTEVALREHARQTSWPLLAERLDPALLFLPRAYLSVEGAERLLVEIDAVDGALPPADQTVLAMLLGAAGARPLPVERYLTSDQGQSAGERDADYARLTARRFTPATRHLLYARGLPRLWRQWRKG